VKRLQNVTGWRWLQIAESVNATGMPENKDAGKKGGKIAKKARLELESKTGKSVITSENYLPPAKGPKQLKEKKDTGEDEGWSQHLAEIQNY